MNDLNSLQRHGQCYCLRFVTMRSVRVHVKILSLKYEQDTSTNILYECGLDGHSASYVNTHI
jgi:hypothetical protein